MELRNIEQAWQSYASQVIRGVSPDSVQYRETQKAFYGGAHVIMSMMRQMGEDDIDDDVGAAHLEAISQELDAFNQKVMTEIPKSQS